MIEIRTQLQKSNSEKEDLKMQIHKLYEEKRNFEGHLEAISSAHDSRITEMHCVIGESLKNMYCDSWQNQSLIVWYWCYITWKTLQVENLTKEFTSMLYWTHAKMRSRIKISVVFKNVNIS